MRIRTYLVVGVADQGRHVGARADTWSCYFPCIRCVLGRLHNVMATHPLHDLPGRQARYLGERARNGRKTVPVRS